MKQTRPNLKVIQKAIHRVRTGKEIIADLALMDALEAEYKWPSFELQDKYFFQFKDSVVFHNGGKLPEWWWIPSLENREPQVRALEDFYLDCVYAGIDEAHAAA